jgi:hypothetical protein
MKTFTIDDIREWRPCYDPARVLPKDWSGTALDILKLGHIEPEDRFWVVLRKDILSKKILILFAVRAAREVQHLMRDERSINALDVAERYAHDEATEEELEAAWDAAWTAAGTAARAAAWAAAGAARAAQATAWAAARDAAWAAARAAQATAGAAWAAALDARDAARDAAWAAALAKQVQILIELVEGHEEVE